MTPEEWAGLALVCALGAMSPGPSLAFVLRNTIQGGRKRGLTTAIGHGIGIGLYAFAFVAVLSGILISFPSIEKTLRWTGVILLLVFGGLMLKSKPNNEEEQQDSLGENAFLAGFGLAFFNPKIAAWMVAVYSQFVQANATLGTKFGMGVLAFGIDAGWYAIVAVFFGGSIAKHLQSKSEMIDRLVGVLLIAFGLYLALF
jgi:threonine/homoserine/homoserine lactone efflux protein